MRKERIPISRIVRADKYCQKHNRYDIMRGVQFHYACDEIQKMNTFSPEKKEKLKLLAEILILESMDNEDLSNFVKYFNGIKNEVKNWDEDYSAELCIYHELRE